MKWLLIISLIYFLGTIALTFVNDSIGFLIFIRALQGIGFCLLTNLVFTMSSNIVPKSRLGEGIVYFAMSTSVGTTVGPLIAIAYLDRFSFQSMMWLTFGLMAFPLYVVSLRKVKARLRRKRCRRQMNPFISICLISGFFYHASSLRLTI